MAFKGKAVDSKVSGLSSVSWCSSAVLIISCELLIRMWCGGGGSRGSDRGVFNVMQRYNMSPSGLVRVCVCVLQVREVFLLVFFFCSNSSSCLHLQCTSLPLQFGSLSHVRLWTQLQVSVALRGKYAVWQIIHCRATETLSLPPPSTTVS